jgi:hypothetical protein
MYSFIKCLFIMIMLGGIQAAFASDTLIVNAKSVQQVPETGLWHKVELDNSNISFEILQQAYLNTSAVDGSTITTTGGYLAKISLTNQFPEQKTLYVTPKANFIDKGIAFLAQSDGSVIKLDEFSQRNDEKTPVYMHGQAFSFDIQADEKSTLWLYVDAKIYAYPLTVSIFEKQTFYDHQLTNNAVTLICISIMLSLGLIALLSYVQTKQLITLSCAGYIGLHGLGWAAASGLLDDILTGSSYNWSYGGVLIFPFAIASASQFSKLLFNCDSKYPRLARGLNIFSIVLVVIGLILPWLAFSTAFLISHIIASIWVVLCISIGIKMFTYDNPRAIYYLCGNGCYALALNVYILSHTKVIQSVSSAELPVVIALTIDCICIFLSLFSWLYHQPKYNPVYRPLRV